MLKAWQIASIRQSSLVSLLSGHVPIKELNCFDTLSVFRRSVSKKALKAKEQNQRSDRTGRSIQQPKRARFVCLKHAKCQVSTKSLNLRLKRGKDQMQSGFLTHPSKQSGIAATGACAIADALMVMTATTTALYISLQANETSTCMLRHNLVTCIQWKLSQLLTLTVIDLYAATHAGTYGAFVGRDYPVLVPVNSYYMCQAHCIC